MDDSCRCASERLSVMIRRNSPAFQFASSKSKLKACPSPSGLAILRPPGGVYQVGDPGARRVIFVEDLPPFGVDVVILVRLHSGCVPGRQ